MNWKDWYLARARRPASPKRRVLFWDEIRPGTSKRNLAAIAKTLDIPDPNEVDWFSLRGGHLFLLGASNGTITAAGSVIRRLAGKRLVRGPPNWLMRRVGWKKGARRSLVVRDEAEFAEILDELDKCSEPADVRLGARAAFLLSYYCGLTPSQVGRARYEDLVLHDGRTYLFSAGRLIDLPPRVLTPLNTWLRSRNNPRLNGHSLLFRNEQKRLLARYPHLQDTHTSIRRMKA